MRIPDRAYVMAEAPGNKRIWGVAEHVPGGVNIHDLYDAEVVTLVPEDHITAVVDDRTIQDLDTFDLIVARRESLNRSSALQPA